MNLMQTEQAAILDAFQTRVATGILDAITDLQKNQSAPVDEIRQGNGGYDRVVYTHPLQTLIHPETKTFGLIRKGLEDMGYSHISISGAGAPRASISYSLEFSKGDYDV